MKLGNGEESFGPDLREQEKRFDDMYDNQYGHEFFV